MPEDGDRRGLRRVRRGPQTPDIGGHRAADGRPADGGRSTSGSTSNPADGGRGGKTSSPVEPPEQGTMALFLSRLVRAASGRLFLSRRSESRSPCRPTSAATGCGLPDKDVLRSMTRLTKATVRRFDSSESGPAVEPVGHGRVPARA
jgi:hypothetical protein